MTTFYVREKFLSLGGDFYIKDESGQSCYQVKGSLLKWVKEFRLLDKNDRPVAKLKKQLFTILPCFKLRLADGQELMIQKKWTWFRPRYEVKGLGIKVQGDLLEMNFSLTRKGQTIATVKQEWFKMTHSYRVTVHDDQYSALALALVIAIDYVKDNQVTNNDKGEK